MFTKMIWYILVPSRKKREYIKNKFCNLSKKVQKKYIYFSKIDS